MIKKECSTPGCNNPHRPNQRYCRACHSRWMSDNRKPISELTPEQNKKRLCRATTNNALKAGLIEPKTECEHCGCTPKRIEKHHEDYDKPLEITWLCVQCHHDLHNKAKKQAKSA